MRWDQGYSNPEVEDRRGESFSGGGGMGGMGLFSILRVASMFGWKGILVGLIIAAFVGFGGQCVGGSEPQQQNRAGSTQHYQGSPDEEKSAKFVGYVLEDVQKTWRAQIPGYKDVASLVLFRRGIHSGCGTATTAVGPFYCPVDKKVYIDLSFYDELKNQLGAPGDFAEAYVIAHEVGHHVQDLKGLLGGTGRDNSIHTELQADCLAGAWARDAEKRGELEMGDIDEALNAASQIGDDTLQRKAGGTVQPETWTHGSSAQRNASFKKGYTDGAAGCGI
ncbi:MAG: neutral zinc metallopeptidase [Deltaproteobacteria bacterium]|nr:neutral zinc metallopeptidase [Deltaproteobacteria bacterium]